MNTVADRSNLTDRIWLKSYPEGVPAEIDPDRYHSLAEVFRESVEKYRTRVAYVSVGTEMTYDECERQAKHFAAWLQSRGVKKGDRVAIMLPNSLQYPVCLFGTLLAGAIVVNVNPLYTVPELAHQLRDSGAQTIVVLENFARTLEQALPGTQVRNIVITGIGDLMGGALNLKGRALNFVMRHVQKQVPPYRLPTPVWLRDALATGRSRTLQPVQLEPQDIAFLQYTGGTTGVAKGAMLTHRNIIANLLQAEVWSKGMLSDEAETNVTLLPLYHIFSLTVNLLMFMTMGGRNILIANPRDTKRVLFILRKERFSGIAGVNTLFNALLEDPEFAKRDFSAMKVTIGGGMAVQRAIAERWKKVTGHTIVEGYGLTECSPVVSMNPPDITEFSGTIGLPAPSTEVRFKRDDGTIAPIGEPGELQVRGPQVMRGYWQRPDETAKVIDADGWFSTGDIGVMDANGYIRLIDRKKDMILVSGFNVYPNEIEDVVALHPEVLEVAAIGVPDPVAGERVKIIVVPRTGALTEAALLEHCRAHLTGYKMPRIVEFRHEELPKSTVGKILRRELRDADPDIQRARAAQAQQ
ncbi:AMP-binding protein [Ralstonia mannitolilytica]|uniref:Long-chain-fatty-acid--CoA ligase n=1 Tax=Ralstonia mannitolilytica TaxID=105219 RepID=A0AAD2AMU8_9RALS|nr:AMP-binding protein [Ralstonia mannitolilytica]ANA33979.1 long-chain fatty acid--CoA ligase [Ralstonia mannitolilytica]MBY4717890.1 AMP-binding protein [Ralstonia mannitolilytica]CAJ0682989.1 Long-chain-fatty-acid--CoA ligase [Ralstonia mannitolilytica]CAJ0683889.1 Long-chain-fatty-acid--CoA ligase [Ralstonia mannitolilytica]CAJ0691539.1 Long-chain-fatty-acid--CoA ligase [Ralstonia mannitolilytica]